MNCAILKVLLLTVFLIENVSAQCSWNKDTEFPEDYPPLLIDEVSWISLKAVEDVNGNRMVNVDEGSSIVIACSGTVITSLGIEVTEGVCSGGSLDIGGSLYNIMDLECTKRIDDATFHTSNTCGDGDIGQEAYIGFIVTGYPFYPIVRVCFDDDLDIPIYAEHEIFGENVEASDGNPDRPSFQDDDEYYETYDPNDCYLTANQDAYATSLGNSDYIDLNGGIYFSRGHLAPNADFLTEMEADATFWYINAIPQWQPYNGGNWAYIESNCRSLAAGHSSNLKVTTGPLNNLNVNALDIWICDDIGIHEIPVPESIWKVVYEPSSNRGVAIITSNHPYQVDAPSEICPNIDCTTISWISINPIDYNKGYTYCCTVQDFNSAYPQAPSYPSAALLSD